MLYNICTSYKSRGRVGHKTRQEQPPILRANDDDDDDDPFRSPLVSKEGSEAVL